MPANGKGVADLNVVPPALIESVEIITGGASAVYGSDALAGVVNFKLKRDFDGVEIDGSWGQADRGDSTQYEAGLTAGTNFAEAAGRSWATWGTPTAGSSRIATGTLRSTRWCTPAGRAAARSAPKLVPARWLRVHRGRPGELNFDNGPARRRSMR